MADTSPNVAIESSAERASPEQAETSAPISSSQSQHHAPGTFHQGLGEHTRRSLDLKAAASFIRHFDNDNGGATGTATPISHASSSQIRLDTPATTVEDEVENPFAQPGSRRQGRLKVIKPLPEPRLPKSVDRDSSDDELGQHQSSSSVGVDEPEKALQRAQQDPAAAGPVEDHPAETQPDVMNEKTEVVDAALLMTGHRLMVAQKWLVAFALVCINFMFIFATWWWPQWWYLYLPFICFPLVLNCIMIVSIACFKTRNMVRPEKTFEPEEKEKLVMIIPCYNETQEEVTRSLDSLIDQDGIDEHKRAIIIICDGRVRGPGMTKSTGDYLNEDILTNKTHREKITTAYRGWDGRPMDVEITKGTYRGLPYYCIVKEANQGKRDSLIVVRSFLYKHNLRHEGPSHIFSAKFFASLSEWLERDAQMDKVDHLIGMDADTVFDKTCIRELLKESKYAHTTGVCGYVAVDFSGGSWNLWSLYQSAEYTVAQGLRRLHQSIATHKVSCLPGCCQLLKICEATCGDHVLLQLFGYHPGPTDSMLKQIRATASEDRNHVCLMLTTHPQAQTRQALRARAYTDVPHSWSVFLSQRRRWTLGATANDVLLVFHRKTQWFERILALCNVIVWCLNIFVIASIGCMIFAFMHQPAWIIMAFVSIMLVPLTYYIVMSFWLPRNFKERVQYLCGLSIFVICGPFLNITVMVFAVFNMDSFGWGKTRKVIKEDDLPEEPIADSKEEAEAGDKERTASESGVLAKSSGYDEEAAQPARGRPAVVAV